MSTVILTKWGNSIGIRIPATILKEANLDPGDELKIIVNKKGVVTLTPITNPQEGWLDAFNTIADMENEKLLINIENNFDADEWKW